MADVADLRYSRNQKIQEKRYCEGRISDINTKLERLRQAKNSMTTYKSQAKTKKTTAENIPGNLTPWEGDKKGQYSSSSDTLTDQLDTYYKNCDRALDAICDAITRLENERNNQYGILGRLVSAINYLGNEIEKLIN